MGSGTSEGRKAVPIEMGKQMFAGPCRDSGTERTLVSEPCGFPLHTFLVGISSDDARPESGPLSKFF